MSHLAQRRQATLDVCGYGRLHLTYGGMTLHFERDEFRRSARDLEYMSQYLTNIQGTAPFVRDVPTRCH